jgi:hypothetical protein
MTNSKYIAGANVRQLLLIKYVFDDVGVLLVQQKNENKKLLVSPIWKARVFLYVARFSCLDFYR